MKLGNPKVGDHFIKTGYVMTPREIAAKWVKRIGLGFHPDTSGRNYSPRLSAEEAREYDADMEILFGNEDDPYVLAVEEMEKAGLI